MIAKIYSPKANIKPSIDYNFKKVEDNKAIILGGNIAEEYQNKAQLKAHYSEFINQNKLIRSVDKNIRHISISLSEGENLDNQTFYYLAEDYLNRMGFEDCPMMVFRHHDTDKEHIHILVSQVDILGKRISDAKDRYRSMEISRELEKEYGLKEVETTKNQQSTQDILTYHNYSISKLLLKLDQVKRLEYEKKYDVIIKDLKPLKNLDIINRVGGRSNDLLNDLNNDFPFGLEKLDKEKLIDKLDEYRNISKSYMEFVNKVQQDPSLYLRPVYNSKGEQSYTYGIVLDKSTMYLKEGQYPPRFNRFSLLSIGEEKSKTFTEKQQKQYLKTAVSKSLRGTETFEQFKNKLLDRGVKCDLKLSQSGNVTGINFVSLQVDNPISFGGSKLDKAFSYNKIQEALSLNTELSKQFEVLSLSPLNDKEAGRYQKTEYSLEDGVERTASSMVFNTDDNNELEKWNRKNKKKKKKKRKR